MQVVAKLDNGERVSGRPHGRPCVGRGGDGPLLRADDLVLGYRRATVVHGVCIELPPGRVTALVGPNGSGKSTVLRSLARLHPAEGGEIRLRGADGGTEDITALTHREFARRVTMLSQSRPSPSGLTVRSIVDLGRHPYRRRVAPMTDADRAAVDRAMALTGISHVAARAVDELSGGELQRVWLATCLAQDTQVLLLDEPTNHLDLRYQVEVLDLVRTLADDHGTAVGVVLHDLDQAASIADEIVVLSAGRVHAVGAPATALTGAGLSEVYGLAIDVRAEPDGSIRIETPMHRHRRRGPSSSQPEENP